MSKWEKIGQVCVDTATLLLCDPCKLDRFDVNSEVEGYVENNEDFRQIKDDCKPKAHNTAIILRTGMGDGYYDVEIKKDADGLIYEMRMKFCARQYSR